MTEEDKAGVAGARTPRADGLRLPARSVTHARTLLSWPCRTDVFGPLMARAREEWAEVAHAIARFEPVTLLVRPEDAGQARALCGFFDWACHGTWLSGLPVTLRVST